TMTLILALLVGVVVSQSEFTCTSCSGPVQTCHGPNGACASVIDYAGSSYFFKGCMTSKECIILNRPGVSSASCCMCDQCNR
uniref:Uncharacterized protein n=1 Tax=Scophthalmus maximus TaxID=52904 RepID=A0A8D3BE09_SCOMX